MLSKINYIFDKKQKMSLIGLFFLILGGTVLELMGVTAILPLVNVVMTPDMIEDNKYMLFVKNLLNIGSVKGFILFLALLLVLVYIVKNIYLIIMNDAVIRFTNDCQNEYATRLIDVYLHQDYLFHVKTNTAELQRNVNVDVQQFIQLVTACLHFIIEMSVCVVLVIFLLQQDVVTTIAVAVTLSAVILIIYVGFRGKLTRLGELNRSVGAQGTKIGLQIFGGVKEIKVLNREDFFVKIFRENAVEYSFIHRKQQLLSYIPKPLIESLCICGLLLTLSFKIYYGSDGDLQKFVPTLSVFAIAAFRMLPSFNRITGYLSSIMYTKPSLDAFYEDLKQTEELISKGKYKEDQVEKLEFVKSIDIRDLSFTYPNTDKVIIDNVSFSIEKNSSVAIIGESGAGKTTFVDVLLGILEPDKGGIYLGEYDIYKNLNGWHKLVGYIPQDIYLIDDSIRKNIAFGVPDSEIDDREIERALEEAQLKDFVDGLPNGLDTRVGERGVMISGGQKQRIGIARALYHDPRILVLDEATSALDGPTEAAVMQAINSFRGSKTLIVIAHRLSTITNCDIIYEVVKGKIIERDKESVLKGN